MGPTQEPWDSGIRPDQWERPEPLETPWGSFALFRIAEEFVAVQSFCPHLQAPLFDGTQSAETITCPWHQWRFSLRDGKRVDAVGLITGGKPCLERLDVRLTQRGTLGLEPPRR
jgi:nitrite reductase/ring-hydroxylating ferredoxin subunit